jgi:hypothetical protein
MSDMTSASQIPSMLARLRRGLPGHRLRCTSLRLFVLDLHVVLVLR